MSLHLYMKLDMTNNTEYTKMSNIKYCYCVNVSFSLNDLGF